MGSVFVAQPPCGWRGWPGGRLRAAKRRSKKAKCSALYMEVDAEKAGVIVKVPGKVEVGGEGREGGKHNDLAPGQVRTSFRETPQLPFSDLKLHFHGGPRASLANPQACGT